MQPRLITLPAEAASCKVLSRCRGKKSCGKRCKCVTLKPVLSGRHIKRTTSIERTPSWVLKFSSNIYWKLIHLHSANTSVKLTRTWHKTCNKRTLQGLFTSKSPAHTPITLFTDVVLRLSLPEDQAGVIHAISPFWMKLCQIEGTTQQL